MYGSSLVCVHACLQLPSTRFGCMPLKIITKISIILLFFCARFCVPYQPLHTNISKCSICVLISVHLSVAHHQERVPLFSSLDVDWQLCLLFVAVFPSCVCVSSYSQPAGGHCHPGLVYWPDVCHRSPHLGPSHSVLHQEEQGWKVSRWCTQRHFKFIHVGGWKLEYNLAFFNV